jgi:hypothetical protein
MCLRAKSSPVGGGKGGIIGFPFSKNNIGDSVGSNFEGAHHLCAKSKQDDQTRNFYAVYTGN